MTWAQRLKRVFNIYVSVCPKCGGEAKVIACIEGPGVIKKILEHLKPKSGIKKAFRLPESRGSPQTGYLAMENPFDNHKGVANDARQGWRSAIGSGWTDHKAEPRLI